MEKVKVSRDFLFVFVMAGTGAFSEKKTYLPFSCLGWYSICLHTSATISL